MDIKELAFIDWQNGMKPRQIAKKHDLSVNTVKSWITRNWKSAGAPEMHPFSQADAPEKNMQSAPIPIDAQPPAAVVDNAKLSAQQKDFCLYYSRIKNATQAYLKAYGCSWAVANVNGPRLLVNARVRDELRRLQDIKSAALDLYEIDVVELHMRIAFADITDFVEFDGFSVRLKDSSQVDGQLIAEVSKGRDGVKIKRADQQRSLAFLERHFLLNPMDKHKRDYDEKRHELELKKFELAKEVQQNESLHNDAAIAWIEALSADEDAAPNDNNQP